MKKTLRFCFIGLATLGVSGLASANELSNAGFEAPDIAGAGSVGDAPTGWTPSNVAGVNNAGPFAPADEGDQFLATGFGGAGADESASQNVTIPVDCSPYDLAVWEAQGAYQTYDSEDGVDDEWFYGIATIGECGVAPGYTDGFKRGTTKSHGQVSR